MNPVPSVTDSEWALLSGLISGGSSAHFQATALGLRETHFNDVAAWLCYRALSSLFSEHSAIDRPLLRQKLRAVWADAERKPPLGPDEALLALYEGSWTASTVAHHARRIVDAATLSSAQREMWGLAESAPDWEGGGAAFLAECQRRLFAIDGPADSRGKMLSDLVPALWEELDAEYHSDRPLRGIGTGIPTLDRMTRGLSPGQLWVIAGKTGHGKSALSGGIALHAAQTAPGGVFSFEMDWRELVERYVFTHAGVSSQTWREKALTATEYEKLRETTGQLARLPVWVEDDGTLTAPGIVSRLRFAAFQNNCRWAVVDYTQLVASGESSGKKESREQEVAGVVKALKATARELGITVVALSQLNDQGEARESRAVEHFADVFLEIKLLDDPTDPDFNKREELAYDLLVRKCRGGRRGKVPMVFFPAQTRFAEMEVNHDGGRY